MLQAAARAVAAREGVLRAVPVVAVAMTGVGSVIG